MSLFQIASVVIVLAGFFSFLNYHLLRLPNTIGVMLIALVSSLGVIGLGHAVPSFHQAAVEMVSRLNFDRLVLHGMLAFLLFAGALQLKFGDLRSEWLPITVLSVVGTILSTAAIGFGLRLVLRWMGLDLPVIDCLLFGALISPTDPVAVIGIMKFAGVPKDLETQLVGESLFNDGMGVVIFSTILELATNGTTPTFGGASMLLAQEAIGGALIGAACGYIAFLLLLHVYDYQVEILITLGLAMGVYTTAEAMHVSALIAVVVAGIVIGNHGRTHAMSEKTSEQMDHFWELIDVILNVILFLLVGVQILVLPFSRVQLFAGFAAVAVALLSRWGSVAALIALMRTRRTFVRGTVPALTWGGLRGGLAVAMCLSLPKDHGRDFLLGITYVVVVFSVIVQGLTVGTVFRRASGKPSP